VVTLQPSESKTPLFSEAFLRRLESLALLYHSAAKSQMQGERRSSRRGQSVEFSDFRPYSLGDDFRRIDWNAYARLERLFLKLFIAEEDVVVHILLDNSPSMNWGNPNKLIFAKQTAAAIGYIALVGLDRVSVSTLFGAANGSQTYFPPVRGKNATLRLFSFLQSVQTGSEDENPSNLMNLAISRITQPGIIMVFSDLMGENWQPMLNQLAGRQHEISLIQVLSSDELSPTISGDFRLKDMEGGAQVEITADFEILQKYQNHLQTWQADWRRFCRPRRIAYLPVSSDLSLEDILFARLPSLGVLR